MAVTRFVILMCLFCGALGQNEENAMDLQDALSMLTVEQEVSVDDLMSQAALNDIEFVDDDTDDVINLELAQSELVGGCSGGQCRFCAKKSKFEFCLEAKLLPKGFELKVTVNNKHVLFDKKITVKDDIKVCKKIKVLGNVCIRIYKVDLVHGAACVDVEFKVLAKPFKLQIACFKIKKGVDTPLIFTKLLSDLVEKELNSLEQ